MYFWFSVTILAGLYMFIASIYIYKFVIISLLGAETTRALIHKAGVGNGSIWMTAVRCSSTNTDITDCQFTSDTSRCDHNDDLAITCQDKSENQACFSNLIMTFHCSL